MSLREMNDYDLMHAIVDSDRPVVAAFLERGTTEARPVESELGTLAREMGDRVIVSVVDTAENPSIARKFGSGEAAFVALFRDGRHLGTCAATLDHEKLAQFINSALRPN